MRLRILSLFLSLLTLPLAASAASMCPDGGTLSPFLASGFSCQVGDLVFSNFSYTSSDTAGALALSATGITVDAIVTSPGLNFQGNWIAPAGQSTQSNITFTVTGTDSQIAGFDLSEVSHDGGTVTIDACGPAPCTPNALISASTDATNLNTSLILSPFTSLTLSEDISVIGANGSADLLNTSTTFSETPEPSAITLLGTALFGLTATRLRR